MRTSITVLLILAPALVGCASMFNPPSSEVTLRTRPEQATCALTGAGGYSALVATPAVLAIPHDASPVQVSCQASGYRPTLSVLDAGPSGWGWANTSFILASGGAAVLGLVVDEALGSDRTYPKVKDVEMSPDKPRSMQVRSREDGQTMRLESR